MRKMSESAMRNADGGFFRVIYFGNGSYGHKGTTIVYQGFNYGKAVGTFNIFCHMGYFCRVMDSSGNVYRSNY